MSAHSTSPIITTDTTLFLQESDCEKKEIAAPLKAAELIEKSIAAASQSMAPPTSPMREGPSSPLRPDNEEAVKTPLQGKTDDRDDPLVGTDSIESESEEFPIFASRCATQTNPHYHRSNDAIRRSWQSCQSPRFTPQPPPHSAYKKADSVPMPTPPQRYRTKDTLLNRLRFDQESSSRLCSSSSSSSSSSTPIAPPKRYRTQDASVNRLQLEQESAARLSSSSNSSSIETLSSSGSPYQEGRAIDHLLANQTRILSLISFAIFGATIVVPLMATGAVPAGCAIATAGVCATAVGLGASEKGKAAESEIEEIEDQLQRRYALILEITQNLANATPEDPEVAIACKAALQEHLKQYQLLLEQLSSLSLTKNACAEIEIASSVASFATAAGPAAANSAVAFIDIENILGTLGNLTSTYGAGFDLAYFIRSKLNRQE